MADEPKIITNGSGQFALTLPSRNFQDDNRALLTDKDLEEYPPCLRDVLYKFSLVVESVDTCVILEGPSGCGKTMLVQTLAGVVQSTPELMVVHLGEQIDGKVLLGTFTSTNTPGEFVWLPGPLTKAVESGMWLLMEDIELATPDVLALLLPLVKNGELVIPGYIQPLKAARGFRIFLTQRTYADGKCVFTSSFPMLQLLRQHSTNFILSHPSQYDIRQILLTKHPNLEALIDTLVSVTSSLDVHIRQLLRLCERVSPQVYHGRITSVEDFMLEIIDCLCGHLSLPERKQLALKLGCLIGGISREKVEQLCIAHRPAVHISHTALSVGRAYLDRSTPQEPVLCFAHTSSALRLLESVCRCVQMNEPVLLVGETGVGKTAVINYLSKVTGNNLVVFNMSEQTESTDLLGGFKPLQVSHLVTPVKEEFERLFHSTFSLKQNAPFLSSVQESFTRKKWRKLLKMMLHSVDSALSMLKGDRGPEENIDMTLSKDWQLLALKLAKFQKQLSKSQTAFAFDFVEGALVEAVRSGSWILLDEINLASSETLQCLSGLLESPEGSFLLPEKLDSGLVKRHLNFRLFCCMNPATDIGKKSLPHSIRSRLTEFYVDEAQSPSDLRLLIQTYLQSVSPPKQLVDGIIKLYQAMKELVESRLQDGTGRKPHYSLRNLCRALNYCRSMSCGTLLRSAFEGFCMSLLSEVRSDFHPLIVSLITRHLSVPKTCINAPIPRPSQHGFISVEGFWLHIGSCDPYVPEGYILTASVKRNIKNLARVISARSHPILLQGPTSAGKTSMVQYLAKLLGYKCLRINNHEHTDLQEYVGMYNADSKGQLIFQEGVLVDAMRHGHWIILDELNLAPTEVLEALNRVLDDNRELFIPETQELVKAHPNFLLFGTQNPPGIYAGRKVLSRAFRNRFVELHFDDILPDELVYILQRRCSLPQSYAKKMVAVMKELQERRSESGIFHGKYGLITLRDLFRWAERYRKSQVESTFHDWEQQLAEDGFMLLGGRLRNIEEQSTILEVVQKHFKRVIDPLKLFGLDGGVGSLASHHTFSLIRSTLPSDFQHLVWTDELQRMAVLVHRAIQFDEPVLLVGATGCGKTSLCQLLCALFGRRLFSINCHLHTDAADFLGGLRPVRNRSIKEGSAKSALFEWSDGVVIQAMTEGGCLLIDEISLAGDAVLERLNSILETERKLLVSEKSRLEGEVYEITASEGFAVFATMNPGGDYGKKELSPALRNRFVEIWCPVPTLRKSYKKIVDHNLQSVYPNTDIPWSDLICDVIEQLRDSNVPVSVRDLLTWVTFMNKTSDYLSPAERFYYGAHLVFVDALGCGGSVGSVELKGDALEYLKLLLKRWGTAVDDAEPHTLEAVTDNERGYGIPPFFIDEGPLKSTTLNEYSLTAPGPSRNLFRLLRAMQLGKPLLLEGPPGVGKTSLVTTLAHASGNKIVRINLSEQTDISDLFGADLPVDGLDGVQFAWKDGPFLKALQNGDWIVLDEMNLASQSVLEGLNACLDHRGEVYIPELGMYFKVQGRSRVFACQNPLAQGGGRKGLPKSFINRFTQVYMDKLSPEDILHICSYLYPNFETRMLEKMISFTEKVDILVKSESGNNPWEFNVRDILRWCSLMLKHQKIFDPSQHVQMIYCHRLRHLDLRQKVLQLFLDVFEVSEHSYFKYPAPLGSFFHVFKEAVQVGCAVLSKESYHTTDETGSVIPLKCQMVALELLAHCVDMGWMAIIVGKGCTGKSSVVRTLAELTGHQLLELPMSSVTDTTDLLGGYEQVNLRRHCVNLATFVRDSVISLLSAAKRDLSIFQDSSVDRLKSLARELSEKYSPAVCNGGEVKSHLLHQCERLIDMIKDIQCLASETQTPLANDMESVLLKVTALRSKIDTCETSGQFEWVDSVLVKAVTYGHWLMISHANFCSPSVLDRLNAVMEPNGVLTLDEQGIMGESEPIIQPHPNFRLFLTMDPCHGEISRAMRNRGIEMYIHPEESILNLEKHSEDWRAMLLSKTSITPASCFNLLQLYPINANVSPHHLVSLARCHQLLMNRGGGDDAASLKEARNVLGWPMAVSSERMILSHFVPLSATASQLAAQASQIITCRDISSVLQALNKASLYPSELDHSTILSTSLSAALEVYVCSSTVEDQQSRLWQLNQLCGMLTDGHAINLTSSWRKVLDNLPDCTSFLEESFGCRAICQVYPSTNPLLSLVASQDQISLPVKMLPFFAKVDLLRILVKNHLETSNLGLSSLNSTLKLSLQAYNGSCPVECLPHHALAYLQPFVDNLLVVFSDLKFTYDNHVTTEVSTKMQMFTDWLAVFLSICMVPGCSLPAVVSAWTLFKSEGLQIVTSELQSHGEWECLNSLLLKIHPLEEAVHSARVYSHLRDHLFCPAVPSIVDEASQAQILKQDNEIRLSSTALPPFSFVSIEAVKARLKNISGSQSLFLPHRNDLEGSSSDLTATFVALQPLVYCIKSTVTGILQKGANYVTKLGREVTNILEYSLQLPTLSLWHLEPLINLDRCSKGVVDPKQVSGLVSGLVRTTSTGFVSAGQLSGGVLVERSFMTEMCYRLLSTPSSEVKTTGPPSIIPIEQISTKRKEVMAIREFIWLHENSSVFCPFKNLEMDAEIIQELFSSALFAVKDTVSRITKNLDEQNINRLDQSQWSNDEISNLFSKASTVLVDHSNDFFTYISTFCLEVQALLNKLQYALNCEADNGIVISELERLELLNQARAKVGLVYVILLTPSVVDPVALSTSEINCRNLLVTQTLELINAWDRHYLDMVGQDVKTLCSPINRSGVSPYLSSLLRRHSKWLEKSDHSQVTARHNERKYVTLQKTMEDVQRTICSPAHVVDLLQNLQGKVMDNSVYMKVTSWEKGVLGAVNMLENEHCDFPDVVHPYSMALCLVLQGVGSLSVIRRYREDCLNWPLEDVLKAVQFPIDPTYHSHLGWLQQLITLLMTPSKGNKPVSSVIESTDAEVILNKRLLRAVLSSSVAHLKQYHRRHVPLRACFTDLLDYFWVTWKKAQEAAKIESLEAESLYRWKSREHHIEQSGDSDYGEYIDMLFPSFDEEFSITDKPEAMSTRLEPSDTEDNDVALSRIDHLSLCDSDVNLICSLHMLLHNKDPLVSLENIQEPVQDLYHLASYCATCTRAVPGLAWDFLLQCTHARMCVTVGNSLSQNNKRAFNVYKEGDVAEAERSLPIINGIVSRVTELLIEWPEHPILNQLLSTCKKVLSLGTHEPLMKLIAGFESIFTKAQEWESYASKAVSLKSELDSLISIILDWRKLEFSFYENLLASCSSEMEASVSRWWFYLFGLCREVQVSGEVNEFTNAIQSFMETSTLGEYEGRLKLINTFRSDMIWTGSLKLADVLGNVFDYYSQFSAYVLTSMGKMTSSLTKAFKDQLSVMRWSDGSYWSVKVTIKNSHKKLVKLIKSYQEILSQPVLPVLTEMSIPLENQSDSTSNDSTSLVAIVRLNTQTKTKSPCNSYKMESSVLLEDKGLVVSEKDACIKMTDVIDIFFVSNQTVSWSESLTELTGNVITTVQQVSCIKYLEDIEPEKRDSAINLRQSLKRKMLSDLFKELTSHGLSFKKGLDFYSDQFPTTVFQLPNGSLPAEMQFEESLWGKMNVYYYRCIARLLALQSAFGNPSKELTMGQVSRCKGFAYILASTISEQRTTLMSVMREFTLLKATARRLNYSLTGNSGANNSDFCHWMRELCDCLEQCLYSLHCVEYLTNIAPDELDVSHTPLVMEALSFNSGLESGNQIATCILKDHKVDLHDAYTMFIKQESLWCTSIPYNLVSKQEFNNLVNGFQLVKRFCDSISSFLTSTTKSGRRSGLFSFLDTYRKHLLQKFTMVSEWVESVSSQEQSAMEGATSNLLVQSFIKSILLAFQNNSPEQVTVSVKSIREMHVQSLSNLKKINIMQITATAGEFHATLCTGVHQVSSQQIESICHLLQHYMSLCHVCIVQLMIVQATVCKLASILFNLFASLGSKGFCKPLAESQSKVSDSFDFVDIEAGGFAEGTGEKNISSQEDVDTENLESGHNEDKSNDRNKSEDDDVVSVADDMSEELCDVEDDERKEEESDVESKDEQYDNTVGDLEAQTEAEEDLNKHMWAPGVEQSEEDLAATDAAGGTENTESESIVAKDDTVCEETKPLVEDGEEREMDMQEPEQTDEQDTMKADDQDELIDDSESIASGMSDALSVVAEECEPFDFEDEANNEAELDEDESHLQDVPEDSALSTVTVCNSSTGCTTSNSMDGSSGQTDSGDAKTEALTEGDNNLGSQPGESSADQSMSNSTSIQNMQERRHRRIPHDEERVVSADLDSVAKRVKFTNPDDAFSDIKKEESSLYRHIHESESSLYDSTAWDWSDVNGKKIVDIETDDKLDENVGDADSNDQHNSGDSAVAVEMLNKDLDDQEPLKEDSSEKAHDGLPSSTLPLNFFSKIKKLERVQAPTISIERDNLIAAVTALHSDNLGDVQSAVKAWRRYVSLTSDLAQSLFEELCIVLTPTSASQLKGDYRSGKRLNMRRVIPFIASNYQNDRIWLRRLKLVERRYQILVAVDDSSSMKENNCMQMAYESLAMITTAVSRITNGQIGVCRFGDSANVLHPLDIPFSDSDGGNILQHLTFTQNRTSFKELLKTVMSIFLENSFKVAAHPTQPNMKCQLLLVLSDGRGVFSDGGMVLNAAIRRLTEFGIFTVFVILDTMSKESITEIKVPVFQDKGPVIKSYLELFPFSFYVIVRDLHKMPRVLGEALRQWFELLAVV